MQVIKLPARAACWLVGHRWLPCWAHDFLEFTERKTLTVSSELAGYRCTRCGQVKRVPAKPPDTTNPD